MAEERAPKVLVFESL